MRWKEKRPQRPKPERWFAWYPVILTGCEVVVWWEQVWRIRVVIDSESYYLYSDSKEGLAMENIAKKSVENWTK